ncbi:MAG: hypothetical protein WEC12_06320 [Balneolaceae bacterium]
MANEQELLNCRPAKNATDPYRPYFFLHEREPAADGTVHAVNTIFLTNRECMFRCIMCDLWKNTLDGPTPRGAIPEQIRFALEQLPKAKTVKLYNNGNFFDRRAIPPGDYPDICDLLSDFRHVIVENHPRLCGEQILNFRDLLDGKLEVALGLETIHPEVLPRLNKKITLQNFSGAVRFLNNGNINSRAFVLLNPPYLTDPAENLHWCLRSVEFAFSRGVGACSIIPTRAGNGIMDQLQQEGLYEPPTLEALEEVFDRALNLKLGRVFADTWGLEAFSACNVCFRKREERLNRMNLEQKLLPRISCPCTDSTN